MRKKTVTGAGGPEAGPAAPAPKCRRRLRARAGGAQRPRLQKGEATTLMGSILPRTSALSRAPTGQSGACGEAGETRARAIGWPRVGESRPEVTVPTRRPAASNTAEPARAARRP